MPIRDGHFWLWNLIYKQVWSLLLLLCYYYYYKRATLTKTYGSEVLKFSIQRQGTSVWWALSSISAGILAAMETTRRKVANWWKTGVAATRNTRSPIVNRMLRSRNEKRRRVWWSKSPSRIFVGHTSELGRQVAGSEKWALPDGTLFSPELVTNEGRGVTSHVIVLPSRVDQSRAAACSTDWGWSSNTLGRPARVALP